MHQEHAGAVKEPGHTPGKRLSKTGFVSYGGYGSWGLAMKVETCLTVKRRLFAWVPTLAASLRKQVVGGEPQPEPRPRSAGPADREDASERSRPW